MTTKERLVWKLQSCCMPDSLINDIMDHCIPKINNLIRDYWITWERPDNEYDNVVHNMIWSLAKPLVYEWLNEHHPQAWFKPLFDDDEMKKIIEEQNTRT